MYCLEKLQRELAYFFDMDLRELPRVQDLLAAQGYTQVQKGDEIIKLEPSAQADSTPSLHWYKRTHAPNPKRHRTAVARDLWA